MHEKAFMMKITIGVVLDLDVAHWIRFPVIFPMTCCDVLNFNLIAGYIFSTPMNHIYFVKWWSVYFPLTCDIYDTLCCCCWCYTCHCYAIFLPIKGHLFLCWDLFGRMNGLWNIKHGSVQPYTCMDWHFLNWYEVFIAFWCKQFVFSIIPTIHDTILMHNYVFLSWCTSTQYLL